MKNIILMMLAGGCGALGRYLVSCLVQERLGSGFPWGTLSANVLGCLIFGFFWTLANERYTLSSSASFIVLTGFVGSFTTFSTMTFDAFQLLRASAWMPAVLYLAGGQLLGIFAAMLGVHAGRLL